MLLPTPVSPSSPMLCYRSGLPSPVRMMPVKHLAPSNTHLYHINPTRTGSPSIHRIQPCGQLPSSTMCRHHSTATTFDLYQFTHATHARSTLHSPLIKVPVVVHGRRALALIDSGATANFIDAAFVATHAIPTDSIQPSHVINLGDGTQRFTSLITQPVPVDLDQYRCTLTLLAVPLSGCDLVLGMPWLVQTNPTINWARRTIHMGAIQLFSMQESPGQQVSVDGSQKNLYPPCVDFVVSTEPVPQVLDASITNQMLFHGANNAQSTCPAHPTQLEHQGSHPVTPAVVPSNSTNRGSSVHADAGARKCVPAFPSDGNDTVHYAGPQWCKPTAMERLDSTPYMFSLGGNAEAAENRTANHCTIGTTSTPVSMIGNPPSPDTSTCRSHSLWKHERFGMGASLDHRSRSKTVKNDPNGPKNPQKM